MIHIQLQIRDDSLDSAITRTYTISRRQASSTKSVPELVARAMKIVMDSVLEVWTAEAVFKSHPPPPYDSEPI